MRNHAIGTYTRRLFWVAVLCATQVATAEIVHTNETILTPTVWSAADNDHIVVGILQVNSSLTIEEGCTIRFDAGAKLDVPGTLSADGGTTGILMTRRDPGDQWQGVRFYANSIGTLQNCTVEYVTAGINAAVYSQNAASLTLENCTLQNSDIGIRADFGTAPTMIGCNITNNADGIILAGLDASNMTSPNFLANNYEGITFDDCSNVMLDNFSISGSLGPNGAIYVEDSGEFTLGPGNVVTGNSWGLTIDMDSYLSAASAGNVPVAGNTNDDGVQIHGGFGAQGRNTVWRNLGVDYIPTTSVGVNAGGTLEIEPGCNIRFMPSRGLDISGTLIALGGSEGILFTRRFTNRWTGLKFNSGSTGTLENCMVQFSLSAGIWDIDANVTVEDSQIRFNLQYGVHAQNGSPPVLNGNSFVQNGVGAYYFQVQGAALTTANSFEDNTTGIHFEECSGVSIENQSITGSNGNEGAIYVEECGAFHFGPGNSISGNSWGLAVDFGSAPDAASAGNFDLLANTNPDLIQVVGNAANTDATFLDLGLHYVVTVGIVVWSGVTLTIEGGVTMEFTPFTGIYMHGTLDATSSGAAISFAGRGGAGWQGVQILSAGTGMLENCLIRHATANNYSSGVYVGPNANVEMTDCLLTTNYSGVRVEGGAVTLKRCTVFLNTLYGIELIDNSVAYFGSDLTEWNAIYGNGVTDDDQLFNGTHNIVAPYVYWGTTETEEIEDQIHHEIDDPLLGRVDYRPWTDSTHSQSFGLAFSDVTPLGLLQPVDATGVAWGDYDGDGDPDLFVSGLSGNRLFENFALNFVDVTPNSIANTAPGGDAQWVDIDDDGDLDLVVVNPSGPMQVVFRDGDSFQESIYVVGTISEALAVDWADIDEDGQLDAVAAEGFDGMRVYAKDPNFVLFNWDGVVHGPDFVRAVACADYTQSGGADVAASGSEGGLPRTDFYYGYLSSLYFDPFTLAPPGPLSHATSAWADPDGDGDLDLFIGAQAGQDLLACRQENGGFAAGCSPTLEASVSTAVSASWADLNNDGLSDLYLCNDDGNNRLYTNLGSLEFAETVDPALIGTTGSGAAAWADYDGDGDLDLFIASNGGENRLLRNDLDGAKHWFQIDLEGIASPHFGEGSRIELTAGGVMQVHEVGTGAGVLAQNSITAEFGLDDATTVDLVSVKWSSGAVNDFGPFAADQRVTLTEQIHLQHHDGELTQSLNALGTSWADFDGDGDEDLFVTTMLDEADRLYRNDNGTLNLVNIPILESTSRSTGSAWGDLDGDGWLDLIVTGAAGVDHVFHNLDGMWFEYWSADDLYLEVEANAPTLLDFDMDGDLDVYLAADSNPTRLLLNAGNEVWNDITEQAGDIYDFYDEEHAAWGDFDDDGDLDLFSSRGGDTSALMRNDDGVFTDITSDLPDVIRSQHASWVDFDNDGDLDLHTNGGTAASSSLIRNEGGGNFSDVTPSVLASSVNGALWRDIDNDGDLDVMYRSSLGIKLILQTEGEFEAAVGAVWPADYSRSHSMGDFDGDGRLDLVTTDNDFPAPVRLFRNTNLLGNNSLLVRLKGLVSNPQGIGAKIIATVGQESQRRDVLSHGDRYSSNSLVAHFGLGQAAQVDELTIHWPSGIEQTLYDVPANQEIIITEWESATAVEPRPTRFALEPGFPNPSSSSTTFAFGLPEPGRVELRVFDLAGRLVSIVEDQFFPAGRHFASWDGRDSGGRTVASGTYFLRLRAGSFESSRSVVLVR